MSETAETLSSIESVIQGVKSMADVFANIFEAFGTIAGYLVELGLTETQAWASIVVLIIGLFILSAKYIRRLAVVLVVIVLLFILASIFGVI